jgi:3-dehydroquinate dehydratase type I
MICIPITAAKTEAAIDQMERAAPLADLIELRIDRMPDAALERLLAARRNPVIVTNRRREEGGAFPGTEEERVALLVQAARLGADYIDIETETAPTLKEKLRQACAPGKVQIIASWHDFTGTPPAVFLKKKLTACMADGPAIVKIVTHADNESDGLRLLKLIPYARQRGQAVIAFCMGDRGKLSRIMAPLFGSAISYAPLEAGESSAPGQLTARRMREILQALGEMAPAAGTPLPKAHRRDGETSTERTPIARETD